MLAAFLNLRTTCPLSSLNLFHPLLHLEERRHPREGPQGEPTAGQALHERVGIDHGLRRIGLATCDVSGLIARELAIIERKSKAEDFELINQTITQEEIEAIVVGIPTNYEALDNQQSQAKSVRKWVAQMAETTDLPIVLWDEQLSSADARDLARSRKRKPTDPIDDLAAREGIPRAASSGCPRPPPRRGASPCPAERTRPQQHARLRVSQCSREGRLEPTGGDLQCHAGPGHR